MRLEHSPQNQRADGLLDRETMLCQLNWMIWASYFIHGQVCPAFAAGEAQVAGRLRQWLCRKGKIEVRRVAALSGRNVARGARLDASRSKDRESSVGEGMILPESRVRTIARSV